MNRVDLATLVIGAAAVTLGAAWWERESAAAEVREHHLLGARESAGIVDDELDHVDPTPPQTATRHLEDRHALTDPAVPISQKHATPAGQGEGARPAVSRRADRTVSINDTEAM